LVEGIDFFGEVLLLFVAKYQMTRGVQTAICRAKAE